MTSLEKHLHPCSVPVPLSAPPSLFLIPVAYRCSPVVAPPALLPHPCSSIPASLSLLLHLSCPISAPLLYTVPFPLALPPYPCFPISHSCYSCRLSLLLMPFLWSLLFHPCSFTLVHPIPATPSLLFIPTPHPCSTSLPSHPWFSIPAPSCLPVSPSLHFIAALYPCCKTHLNLIPHTWILDYCMYWLFQICWICCWRRGQYCNRENEWYCVRKWSACGREGNAERQRRRT